MVSSDMNYMSRAINDLRVKAGLTLAAGALAIGLSGCGEVQSYSTPEPVRRPAVVSQLQQTKEETPEAVAKETPKGVYKEEDIGEGLTLVKGYFNADNQMDFVVRDSLGRYQYLLFVRKGSSPPVYERPSEDVRLRVTKVERPFRDHPDRRITLECANIDLEPFFGPSSSNILSEGSGEGFTENESSFSRAADFMDRFYSAGTQVQTPQTPQKSGESGVSEI